MDSKQLPRLLVVAVCRDKRAVVRGQARPRARLEPPASFIRVANSLAGRVALAQQKAGRLFVRPMGGVARARSRRWPRGARPVESVATECDELRAPPVIVVVVL